MFTPGVALGGVMVTVAGAGAVTVTVDGGAAVGDAAVDAGDALVSDVAFSDDEQAAATSASTEHAIRMPARRRFGRWRYASLVISPVPLVDRS
jgi:hypothetical protein